MKLKLTFDPANKAKTEPHTLVLDPVPPLLDGSKPPKDEDDTSTRASSPTSPDRPFTPVKSASAPKVRDFVTFTLSSGENFRLLSSSFDQVVAYS